MSFTNVMPQVYSLNTETLRMSTENTNISPEWLAGFFDGEGCISATVAGKYRRVILRVSIVNTDYALMRAIADQYAGQFVYRKTTHAHWKRACYIVWTNSQAARLLDEIGHLLILKARQANLAKEFLALRSDPNRFTLTLTKVDNGRSGTVPSRHITSAMLKREQEIKQEFHQLNRKGVA